MTDDRIFDGSNLVFLVSNARLIAAKKKFKGISNMVVEHSLQFYTHPMSRACIVRWMLEEVGAKYESIYVALGKKIEDPEFLSLNPMGKVPVIVHNGRVVTESAAICAYLADVFPEAGLAPSTNDRDAYYRWLFFAAGCLETAAINKSLGVQVTAEQESMVGYRTLEATMDTLQWQLEKAEFVVGDSFTAADVYVGSQISWGMEFGTIEKREVFQEYVEKVTARPASVRATNLDQELAQKHGLVHP